jgi:alpha-1,3/alpha-1,6-mannosyltransferase
MLGMFMSLQAFPVLVLCLKQHVVACRAPLDWLEQTTTGCADLVLVNSAFTQGVFASTFPALAARGVAPEVLHPCVAVPSEEELAQWQACWRQDIGNAELAAFISRGPMLLSINRSGS